MNDYELLDSGQGIDSKGEMFGEKLERFGSVILRRPDPEVLWKKSLSEQEWQKAHATFIANGLSKKWQKNMEEGAAEKWPVMIGSVQCHVELGAFKHVGVFPEQLTNWNWMVEKIQARQKGIVAETDTETSVGTAEQKIKVLNLFGYTGVATCALARAGAEVTHVDALESNITKTKENLALNDGADAPVRLIVDDVRKFVEREIRRGAHYDAIIMDPPVYGKGDKKRSKKSEWRLEDDFIPLLERIKELLSEKPLFWVISGYASEYSQISYKNALQGVLPGVVIDSGELTIMESLAHRPLPAGIFVRTEFIN